MENGRCIVVEKFGYKLAVNTYAWEDGGFNCPAHMPEILYWAYCDDAETPPKECRLGTLGEFNHNLMVEAEDST